MPFRRELSAVQVEYNEMISALERRDAAGVRIAGCRLVLAWLRVEAALIKVIERREPELAGSGRMRNIELALNAANRSVRAVFYRALAETLTWSEDVQGLRAILRWLDDHLEASSAVGYRIIHATRHPPGRARPSRR